MLIAAQELQSIKGCFVHPALRRVVVKERNINYAKIISQKGKMAFANRATVITMEIDLIHSKVALK